MLVHSANTCSGWGKGREGQGKGGAESEAGILLRTSMWVARYRTLEPLLPSKAHISRNLEPGARAWDLGVFTSRSKCLLQY